MRVVYKGANLMYCNNNNNKNNDSNYDNNANSIFSS